MTAVNVLHSVPSLNVTDGGPARSVPALAAAEAANGADVVVWSQQKATIDLTPFKNVRFVTGDIEKLPRNPDVIHDHGLWLSSNHNSARFGRHRRIPRVVSPRGMLEPWCLKHRRLRKQVAWTLYQYRDLLSATSLHATSESEARQFRRIGLRQPIIQLPNGVGLPEDDESTIQKHSAKKEALFLSRLHPVKGLENLLTAWRQVSPSDWMLKIVGSDEDNYRSKLQELIQSLGLGQSVQLCEGVHTNQKWSLLRNAEFLVLPSFSENFGIVAAEALGVGTPVLTTTGTPWSEIPKRKCGWYVEPTVEGIVSGLREAMASTSAELMAMGNRGRVWMQSSFSWEDIGRRMLNSYDWLLSGKNSGENEHPAQIETVRRAA